MKIEKTVTGCSRPPYKDFAIVNIGDRPRFLRNQGAMGSEENSGLSPIVITLKIEADSE
jgi:hypothetical protein